MSQPSKASRIADAIVFLAAIAAIAVVANIILALLPPSRVDLTEDQLYTLSPGSLKIVDGLQEPLTVKFFVSENLQYPDHNLEQRVSDLLQEYASRSNGKLIYEVIHPKETEVSEDDPTAEDPSEEGPRGFGIEKIPVGTRDKDEVALRMVYKGIAFVYGDKMETIKDVRGTDNLEYEISKRIKILTTPEASRNTVGFVSGYGGPADQQEFVQSINGAFDQIYGGLIKAESVDLKDSKSIPDTIDALIILNPQNPFDAQAQYALDQFLMKGKGIGWFQTTIAPDPRMPMLPTRNPVATNLEDLFETYGVKLNRDLVLDYTNNIVAVTFTERGLVPISNPTMPKFTDIDTSSVITRDIPTLCFPLASSLEITEAAKNNTALSLVELVKTEKDAIRRKDATSVSFEEIQTPPADAPKGPFLVAASLQGPFKSHWADKDAPPAIPDPANPAATPTPAPKVSQANDAARIVVVGNGDFMFPNQQTGYGQQFSSLGAMFLLNSVDWLVQDEDLITIRAKGLPRVIKGVHPDEYTTYQLANIVGVPALFALIGLFIGFRRRQRQRNLTV